MLGFPKVAERAPVLFGTENLHGHHHSPCKSWTVLVSTEQFLLSEDNYPFKKIFDVIAEQLGTKKPQIPITIRRAEWAWRLFALREAITGKRSYFSAENARSAVQDRKFDGQKILKQANSFTYTPVLKEVEKICTYYKTVQIEND